MVDLQGQPLERRRFFETLDLSPIAMLVTDPTQPDNPIQLANDAFCELTGYSRGEILGRNCRFLAGPDTDKAASAEVSLAIREQRPLMVEILNYRRDGTPFRNGLTITPLFETDGALRWFVGSQVDLGASSEFPTRGAAALSRVSALTPRQQEVLVLLAHGFMNKQIAFELKISEKTVEIHRANLIRRLSVATSAEAIRLAIEAGF